MSWTLSTSGAAVRKAGLNANSTIAASGAALAEWSDQAEGEIAAATRRDWVASYSGLSTAIKQILGDAASSLVAMKIISYDITGYLAREADTLLNVNDEITSRQIKILKDFKSNELKTP